MLSQCEYGFPEACDATVSRSECNSSSSQTFGGRCVGIKLTSVTLLGRHLDGVFPHYYRTGVRKGKKEKGLRDRTVP